MAFLEEKPAVDGDAGERSFSSAHGRGGAGTGAEAYCGRSAGAGARPLPTRGERAENSDRANSHTMAFDLTCFTTFQANSSASISERVGVRSVTVFSALSASW